MSLKYFKTLKKMKVINNLHQIKNYLKRDLLTSKQNKPINLKEFQNSKLNEYINNKYHFKNI